jgi:fatty acid desaturase
MSDDDILVTPNNEEELRQAALYSIKRKREFSQHLLAYVVVNAVLVGIWAISGGGSFWPAWIIGFWGIGLIFHAYDAYGRRRMVTEDQISKEMERMRR